MRPAAAWLGRNVDALIALALCFGYWALLLITAGSLGFMRDEGFYFWASRRYGEWFQLLAQHPSEALSALVVDRFWSANHEHPALIKTLFALSNRGLSGFFSQTSSSFRFPAMGLSSLAVALTFWWGRRTLGRAGGLVAALSFAFMPHVFFHAHLACFDLPVSAMWLITSYVYVRSLESKRRGWWLGAGVAYGLLLDTKHNSWIFPFAVLGHFVLTEGRPLLSELLGRGAWWRRLPAAWLSMGVLGPLLFLALWPWLWHDTVARLHEYVAFHTGHEYYNMEFLGRTYWKPPMPRGYAWLMTLATVPLVTLALAAVGALTAPRLPKNHRHFAFWAVSIAASYAPWLSSGTPIFGGTKHWMTAYPFLCLLAARGFSILCARLGAWAAERKLPERAVAPLVGASLSVAPLVMTIRSHPFALSFYTPVVGGAAGAATLGLNRTFWGYTTGSLAGFLNERAAPGASIFVHDTALQSWDMLREDGRIREDLRGTLAIHQSSLALYHHEQHMSAVEYQIWVDYDTVVPARIETYDGVPVVWVYERARP